MHNLMQTNGGDKGVSAPCKKARIRQRHANHLTAVAFYANRGTQAAHVDYVKTSSRKADK